MKKITLIWLSQSVNFNKQKSKLTWTPVCRHLPVCPRKRWPVLSAGGAHCSQPSWPGGTQTVGCTKASSHTHTAEDTAQRHLQDITHTHNQTSVYKLRIHIHHQVSTIQLFFTLTGPAHFSTHWWCHQGEEENDCKSHGAPGRSGEEVSVEWWRQLPPEGQREESHSYSWKHTGSDVSDEPEQSNSRSGSWVL